MTSAMWYVLIGFVLGQGAALLACYLGEILKRCGDDDEVF